MMWNDKMSVGVGSLDGDHKKLVGLLNELYDAVQAGKGKDALGKTLDGLIDYTKIHFANEEKFFRQTAYPDFVEHKKQHDDLTHQVIDVQQKYKSGATGTLSLEVMNFLKNWLINHIRVTDKKYGPYLNSKGIH
ncbi:MAG: bacteriohemerythrin [Terriglobales bacterium]|jgi:hemerythrin